MCKKYAVYSKLKIILIFTSVSVLIRNQKFDKLNFYFIFFINVIILNIYRLLFYYYKSK